MDWDDPLLDDGLRSSLAKIKDANRFKYYRPEGPLLKALKSCLRYTVAEWASSPRSKRDPYLLLELWEKNVGVDGPYHTLCRVRLDWLGYLVLGSVAAGMFACHYSPDDAREVEAQVSRVLNGMLGRSWTGYPSFREGVPTE